MSRILSVFFSMIQTMDPTWRVVITFVAAVAATCLLLFVFLPLFLSLLALVLRLIRKGILALTEFCLKAWGRLVIKWRKKAGRYPQFLVSIEDFFVRIVAALARFLERIIEWKPPYGAIAVRVVLVSCILVVLLTVSLWVLPGTNAVLTSAYVDWEREYFLPGDKPAEAILDALDQNRDRQVYYRLSGNSANIRKAPEGDIITTLTDSGLLLRYLGKTTDQWLNVEYFDGNRKVQGWIHETMVSRWRAGKKALEYLKPGSSIRLSAPQVPLFNCELIGFERAADGTLHLILKEK